MGSCQVNSKLIPGMHKWADRNAWTLEVGMSSTRDLNSPLQNFLNLAVHLALVLKSLSLAFGDLNSMFGSRASVSSAPIDISGFVDFMAESTVAKTDLHCAF